MTKVVECSRKRTLDTGRMKLFQCTVWLNLGTGNDEKYCHTFVD